MERRGSANRNFSSEGSILVPVAGELPGIKVIDILRRGPMLMAPLDEVILYSTVYCTKDAVVRIEYESTSASYIRAAWACCSRACV